MQHGQVNDVQYIFNIQTNLPSTMSFNNNFLNRMLKYKYGNCRIILSNILKCSVQVERLSPTQIAQATKYKRNKIQLSAEQHDHCYSKASLVSLFGFVFFFSFCPHLDLLNNNQLVSPCVNCNCNCYFF